MSERTTELEKLENGDPVTLYPHGGVALLKIAKVWAMVIAATVVVVVAQHFLPQDVGQFLNYGAILLWVGAVMFAAHQFLHYSNTYLQISDEVIVFRKGWIPSVTDTIFWVNIKDINTSTSVGESMLGTGTIILLVAIRNIMGSVRIPYIPQHEAIASHIRERVGKLTAGTQQVTYT